MTTPKSFVDLQAGFYNALSQGLGFSPDDNFQVVQPSPPLIGGKGGDQDFFNDLNIIPPFSLTRNVSLPAGDQFLSNYQTATNALLSSASSFEETVGPKCTEAYYAAIQKGQVTAGDPLAFRAWAMQHGFLKVATSGASALAEDMLEPVFAAQMNVSPYKPAGKTPVDFTPDYARMVDLLKVAPTRDFVVETTSWDTDIKSTWAKGTLKVLFGLLSAKVSVKEVDDRFAAGSVHMKAHFDHVLPLTATPGDWYSSGAFALAYHNKGKAPWNPKITSTTWDTIFGAENGSMQRFIGSLVLVNNMDILVTSQAVFSESEQEEISVKASSGIWPFYSVKGEYTDSSCSFDKKTGTMTVHITSKGDIPIVIGCTVLPVKEYLGGHAKAAQKLAAQFYK